MSPSSVAQGDIRKESPLPSYQYDLRLEIGVKDPNDTIPVVAIFRDLARKMKEAANGGNNLVVLTATDNLYFEQKELTSEEFQKAFQVDEVKGKTTKVLLGFKIRTMTKLSELKTRLMHSYLRPHNLFLREHKGGFENGIKTYAYGYLKYDHPDHFDVQVLNQKFARLISEAWKNLDKDEKKKWKNELPNLFFGSTGIMLPMIFTKEKLMATHDSKPKINTFALVVSTHAKYGKFAKQLLDHALLNKKINNLIPFALNRDNQDGFYYLAVEQARFIENHRNIPILQVPLDAASVPGNQGQTLKDLLQAHVHIQRVAYEPAQNRYHISTSSTQYRAVYEWIERILKEHQFPFAPQLRPLKYGNSPSYGDIFKDAVSVATNTYVSSSTKVPTTTPWKHRPPLAISYVPTDAAFPPLPAKPPTQTTASTTSETLEDDTIQSAISAAIKKLEDQHKSDLMQLKQEFQAKLAAVESQMKNISQQVASQTYQALTGEGSPLATKADNEHLRLDINVMKTQLATLLSFFQTKQTDTTIQMTNPSLPHTPPPSHTTHPKRSRVYTTPVKMKPLGDDPHQEYSVSSAASTSDTGMEGCDD